MSFDQFDEDTMLVVKYLTSCIQDLTGWDSIAVTDDMDKDRMSGLIIGNTALLEDLTDEDQDVESNLN